MKYSTNVKGSATSSQAKDTSLLYDPSENTPKHCELSDVQEAIRLLLRVEFFYQELRKYLDEEDRGYYEMLKATTVVLQIFIPGTDIAIVKSQLVPRSDINGLLGTLHYDLFKCNKEASKKKTKQESMISRIAAKIRTENEVNGTELLVRKKFYELISMVWSSIMCGRYSVDDEYIQQSHLHFAYCVAKQFEDYCTDGQIDLVKWLLSCDQYQYDITKWREYEVNNPLVVAVRSGSVAVVKHLYEHCPVLKQNDLLITAIKWGRTSVVTYLSQKPDMSDHIQCIDLINALEECENFASCVPFLLRKRWPDWEPQFVQYMSKKDVNGNYAIHLAIRSADVPMLRLILQTKVGFQQLSMTDAANRTPEQLCRELMSATSQVKDCVYNDVWTCLTEKQAVLALSARSSVSQSTSSTGMQDSTIINQLSPDHV